MAALIGVIKTPLILNEKNNKQCAKCGSCTVVCPVFKVTGRETVTARGKLHLLETELAAEPSGYFQDIFAQCMMCGACEEVCSRDLPIRDQVVQARSTFSSLYGRHPLKRAFVRKVLSSPGLLEGLIKAGINLSRLSVLPEESGLRIKLGLLESRKGFNKKSSEQEGFVKAPDRSKLSYFSGCMARYLQPSIGEATGQLAKTMTGSFPCEPETQVCCGLAALSAGKLDEARELARKNIEAFDKTPGEILTSCASCSSHLKKYPALFADDPSWQEKAGEFSHRVSEFTSFVNAGLQDGELAAESLCRAYYHEPCHLRFGGEGSGAALQVLNKIGNLSQVLSDEGPKCCGQGGLFHLGYPELSGEIFSQVYDQLNQGEVDVVVTTCSGCLMQWQAGLAMRKSEVKGIHLALLLRSCFQANG